MSDNHPLLKVNDFIGIRPFTCMIMESLFFYLFIIIIIIIITLIFIVNFSFVVLPNVLLLCSSSSQT